MTSAVVGKRTGWPPIVLEFLDLKNDRALRESDLEQVLIDKSNKARPAPHHSRAGHAFVGG